MIVTKINQGKFLCGFCGTTTTKTVRQWTGNGKEKVSNVIKCEKCNANIPQLNQIGGQNGNKK